MKTLVVGYGEIGRSVYEILSKEYPCQAIDKNIGFEVNKGETFDIMHVCFPYSDEFIKEVKRYKKLYKPKYVVIHSTVPVGTNRKLGSISSPVIGLHPHLAKSLKTFTKFLGGEKASEVANYFRRAGMKVYLFDKPETTELMKIQCTTNYALNIEFTKDMKEQCKKYGVPFEAFTIWNDNYNKGYESLGMPEYHRYNLVPIMTKQGGHCTIPNLKLLKTKFTEFLKSIC